MGFANKLGLQLRFAFASLSSPSMLSFHFGRTADSQLIFMCSAFSKSFDSTLVGLYMASALVLALWSLISSRVTGSSPYNNREGVKFDALQTEVL
jgi:hypothetical protein